MLKFESKNICFAIPKGTEVYRNCYSYIAVLKLLKAADAFQDPKMDDIIIELENKVSSLTTS